MNQFFYTKKAAKKILSYFLPVGTVNQAAGICVICETTIFPAKIPAIPICSPDPQSHCEILA